MEKTIQPAEPAAEPEDASAGETGTVSHVDPEGAQEAEERLISELHCSGDPGKKPNGSGDVRKDDHTWDMDVDNETEPKAESPEDASPAGPRLSSRVA